MQKLKISGCAVQSVLKNMAQLLTDQDAADPGQQLCVKTGK